MVFPLLHYFYSDIISTVYVMQNITNDVAVHAHHLLKLFTAMMGHCAEVDRRNCTYRNSWNLKIYKVGDGELYQTVRIHTVFPLN